MYRVASKGGNHETLDFYAIINQEFSLGPEGPGMEKKGQNLSWGIKLLDKAISGVRLRSVRWVQQ